MATANARVNRIISNLRNLSQGNRLDNRGAIYQYCGTVFDLCRCDDGWVHEDAFTKFKLLAERLVHLENLRDSLNDCLMRESLWIGGSPLVLQSSEWQSVAWGHHRGIADQVARTESDLRCVVSAMLDKETCNNEV